MLLLKGMIRRIRNILISIIVVYILLFGYSPSLANTVLAFILVAAVPIFFFRWLFLNYMYKYSITYASKQFVLNNNALHNDHVTVIFTPDEKLVVMDNMPSSVRPKRMFTLKKGKLNVNRAWNRVCRVFDSFVTLDSLVSFYSYDTKVEVITLEEKLPKRRNDVNVSKTDSGPKFVEMNNIQADTYAKDTNKPNEKGAQFVEMNNIKEQEAYTPKPQQEEVFANLSDIKEAEKYVPKESQAPEFTDLGDILSTGSNKIDVNYATASEISILPGVNIVMAKKIVEYRDLNGLFKSEDEFIQVANVKEHFVSKIRSKIIIGKKIEQSIDDDYSEGRIVDF